MSDLRDRLKAFGGVVRQAAPADPVPEPPRSAPLSAPIRELLKKRDARHVLHGSYPPRAVAESHAATAAPGVAMHAPVPAGSRALPPQFAVESNAWGEFGRLVETTKLPFDAGAVEPEILKYYSRDTRLSKLDPADCIFLDTETTSLSGGAGVLVFMTGIGRMAVPGDFQLTQFFLLHPGEERAVLEAINAELAAARGVVTFFGKSFDRHRLADKMKIHGMTCRFPTEQHADLYHICRARFGWRLPDVRLRTVEREILKTVRNNDLPGSEAPAAYFNYLAGRPTLLPLVFKHNRDDVISLVHILQHCGRALDDRSAAAEQLAAARGAVALRDFGAALPWAMAAKTDPRCFRAAAWLLLEIYKKTRSVAQARDQLQQLSAGGDAEATVEWMKLLQRTGSSRAELEPILTRASNQAWSVPVGSARDRIHAAISRAKGRLEQIN